MIDMQSLQMSFTWFFLYLAILAQHFSDGYVYNTVWMAGIVPLMIRFFAARDPNLLLVRWKFLFLVIIMSGGLLGAFMNVTPEVSKGTKEFGKKPKSNIKVAIMYLGFFLFSLLVLSTVMSAFPVENMNFNNALN